MPIIVRLPLTLATPPILRCGVLHHHHRYLFHRTPLGGMVVAFSTFPAKAVGLDFPGTINISFMSRI